MSITLPVNSVSEPSNYEGNVLNTDERKCQGLGGYVLFRREGTERVEIRCTWGGKDMIAIVEERTVDSLTMAIDDMDIAIAVEFEEGYAKDRFGCKDMVILILFFRGVTRVACDWMRMHLEATVSEAKMEVNDEIGYWDDHRREEVTGGGRERVSVTRWQEMIKDFETNARSIEGVRTGADTWTGDNDSGASARVPTREVISVNELTELRAGEFSVRIFQLAIQQICPEDHTTLHVIMCAPLDIKCTQLPEDLKDGIRHCSGPRKGLIVPLKTAEGWGLMTMEYEDDEKTTVLFLSNTDGVERDYASFYALVEEFVNDLGRTVTKQAHSNSDDHKGLSSGLFVLNLVKHMLSLGKKGRVQLMGWSMKFSVKFDEPLDMERLVCGLEERIDSVV